MQKNDSGPSSFAFSFSAAILLLLTLLVLLLILLKGPEKVHQQSQAATIVKELAAGRAVSMYEFDAAFPMSARSTVVRRVSKELSVPYEDVHQIIVGSRPSVTYQGTVPASLRPTTAPATQPVAVAVEK